jgi:arylsulfatase A-like enzyme
MTRRNFILFAAIAALSLAPASAPAPPQPAKPKLVVAIVIDQFRYDYLTRFGAEYNGGLALLLRRGAVFTNARYQHFPTVTAVGHAVIMTGAMPSASGIVGNEWFDRQANKQVTSVSDDATGFSPRKLLVSTLGDEMKIASHGQCRVIGISLKDRAAILPAGHMADGAYWFDPASGNFVSSTFYFPKPPEWVREFNRSRPQPIPPAALEASPAGNDLVEAFAERAIEAEHLGAHPAPDLLTLSFSSNDYVGHLYGPDSPEVHDISLRTDRTLGRLFDFLDHRLGLANVLIVLTADHGVSPLPELLAERKMPGGRLPAQTILQTIQTALTARFGDGKWVVGVTTTGPYLNRELIRAKKLDEALVEDAAAEAVARIPHVLRVYTRGQLLKGRVASDLVGRAVLNGFFPARSSDLAIVYEPYWIADAHGATHGSPFDYDTHVPVIFLSPRIKPGRYDAEITPNDIAPTLATLLEIKTPNGSVAQTLVSAAPRLISAPGLTPREGSRR